MKRKMEKFIRTRLGLLIKATDRQHSATKTQYDEELKTVKSELAKMQMTNEELSLANATLISQIQSLQEKLDEEPKANKPVKQKRKSSEYKDLSPDETDNLVPAVEPKKAKKSPTKPAGTARFMRLRGRHT